MMRQPPLHRRAGAPAFRSSRWTDRRRRLLRLRSFDAITGWVLALLVLASLVMGGVIWSGALWASSPIAHQLTLARAYQVGGDVERGGDAAALLVPERLVLLYGRGEGDEALDDPTDPGFDKVWVAAQTVLGGVTQAELATRVPLGFKQVADAIATFGGGAHGCDAGIEIDLGSLLPWNGWLQIASGSAPAGPADLRVDRVLVLPGLAGKGSGAALYLLAGAVAQRVDLPQGASVPIINAACSLRGQLLRGAYPVAPIVRSGASAALYGGVLRAVPQPKGLLVPSPLDLVGWGPRELLLESLDPNRLALAIFPEPLTVHTFRTAATASTLFTNVQGWELTVGNGQSTLFTPPADGPVPSWTAGLREALRYVDLRGGWPQTAWLAAAGGSGPCTLTVCATTNAYSYVFATRLNGLPVLSPANAPPSLDVTIGGGGQVTFYARAVPVPGPAAGVAQHPPLTARDAVDAVYQHPPAALASGGLEVVGVLPAWVPLAERGLLEPAWAVEVDRAGGGAPVTVLVDAETDQVLGSLQGPTAGGG